MRSVAVSVLRIVAVFVSGTAADGAEIPLLFEAAVNAVPVRILGLVQIGIMPAGAFLPHCLRSVGVAWMAAKRAIIVSIRKTAGTGEIRLMPG